MTQNSACCSLMDMTKAQSKLRASLGLTAGLVVATGCGDDEWRPATCADFQESTEIPDIPLTYSTEHLDIHVDEGRIMCAGTPQEYERFYQYVASELSIDLSQRVPVYVTWPNEYCTPGSAGCREQDGVVFAYPGATLHEMTHGLSCEWRFRSAKPWTEGLAVAFEATPLTGKSDPREFVTAPTDEVFYAHYQAAGHFVRWLLEERGPIAFRELYTRSPLEGGDGVLAVLAKAYAQDVESLFDEYDASAPYMWVPHRQCADVPRLEPVAADVWEFDTTFDCDDPTTLGPWERDGTYSVFGTTTMYQSFLIDIESAGSYRVTRDEVETGILIERCIDETGLSVDQAQTVWMQDTLVPTLQLTSDIDLTPGTYRVDVLREYAPPHSVSLRIEPTPG